MFGLLKNKKYLCSRFRKLVISIVDYSFLFINL